MSSERREARRRRRTSEPPVQPSQPPEGTLGDVLGVPDAPTPEPLRPQPPQSEEDQRRRLDEIRLNIKAKDIIQRLTLHTMAPEDIMSPSQVAAAKVLLGKIIPDLKAVEHTGALQGTPSVKIEIVSPVEQSKDITPNTTVFNAIEVVAPTTPTPTDTTE